MNTDTTEIFMTSGKKIGRILYCTENFDRGNGEYFSNPDPKYWKVANKELAMADEDIAYYAEMIHKTRVNTLQRVVERHKAEGFKLLDKGNGIYQVVQKRKMQ